MLDGHGVARPAERPARRHRRRDGPQADRHGPRRARRRRRPAVRDRAGHRHPRGPRAPARRLPPVDPAAAAHRQGGGRARGPRLRAARRPAGAGRAGARAPASSRPPTPSSTGAPPTRSWPRSCTACRCRTSATARRTTPARRSDGRQPVRAAGALIMREALRGLTTRGRSFLAAAAAAGISALVLGERDLLRVAVLLAALPLLAAAYVGRSRYKLACTRSLEPGRAPVGSSARVILRLQNMSRLPTGTLLLEDRLPYALGSRPRVVLERLGAHQASSVAYTVRADVRGRYPIGPLVIRLTDPFGLCELTRSFPSVDRLTVIPHVVAAARRPARRRVPRHRRQPRPVGGRARRGRRRHPRIPPRRRPAPGALALHRAHRRADGAPRGAALGEPGHRGAGHPGLRAPRRGPHRELRVGGLGHRQHRHAPAPRRLQAAPGHRLRHRHRRHRDRRRGRRSWTPSPTSSSPRTATSRSWSSRFAAAPTAAW